MDISKYYILLGRSDLSQIVLSCYPLDRYFIRKSEFGEVVVIYALVLSVL